MLLNKYLMRTVVNCSVGQGPGYESVFSRNEQEWGLHLDAGKNKVKN